MRAAARPDVVARRRPRRHPELLLDEIEHFFQVYKDLEGHEVQTDGFEDLAAAKRVVDEAFARAGTAR